MKVSCLMVTLPSENRQAFFKHSVDAFCRQTHDNKELVIVLDHGPLEARAFLKAHVASLGRDDIRFVEPDEKLSLGGLRNVSRVNARGDYVCHWDDDDWHHPQRIEKTLEALVKDQAKAAYLQEVMQIFPAVGEMYWTNFRNTEPKCHTATLLSERSVVVEYPDTGPDCQGNEDLVFCLRLQKLVPVTYLAGMAHLYVYVSHGNNVRTNEHHRMLATELGISKMLLARRESSIREGLAHIDFGARPIQVMGNNGPAFVIESRSV
jgi:Glycosyl transferase family 2